MNRKQRKLLREQKSTKQLMGIDELTEHGIKTEGGELIFYLVSPDNLSVLSDEGVRARVNAMSNLLRSDEKFVLAAFDSRESFQRNKDFYQERCTDETSPQIRELLRKDSEHLDAIQSSSASAREFALLWVTTEQTAADETQLKQMEKRIHGNGFRVRLARRDDVKRLLAVYYCQSFAEDIENYDGERSVMRYGE